VRFPRPRSLDVKKSQAFLESRNQVWDLLREEVLKLREGAPEGRA